MKNKLYRFFIIGISLAMLLSACGTPSALSIKNDDKAVETADQSPVVQVYKHDSEKYPLTTSLASRDDVDTVGISVGGVTVDGQKYVRDGIRCVLLEGEPIYMLLGDVYLPNIGSNSMTDIPDGCPVVMYSDDIEIINNTDMTIRDITYTAFTTDKPKVEHLSEPTEPGMYWLLMVAESSEQPWLAEDYTPTDRDTFITAYYYLFAVSVE